MEAVRARRRQQQAVELCSRDRNTGGTEVYKQASEDYTNPSFTT